MVVNISTYSNNNNLSNLGYNIDVNSKGVDRSRIVSSNLQQYSFIEENGDRVENNSNLSFTASSKYIYIDNDARNIITSNVQPIYSFYNAGWYNGFDKALKIAYVNSLFCNIDYFKKIFNQSLSFQWQKDVGGNSNCLFTRWIDNDGIYELFTTTITPSGGTASGSFFISNFEGGIFQLLYQASSGNLKGDFDTDLYVTNNSGTKNKQVRSASVSETLGTTVLPSGITAYDNMIGKRRIDYLITNYTGTATSFDLVVRLSGAKRRLVF